MSTIRSGERIGPYEVVSPLGAGGMGEVYRARDPRLARDVAIKALPAEFATDSERLARFAREARLLAALNHPNVAGIHGMEEHEGRRFLVLELVPGETLAARLAAGPLPVPEALRVGMEIAEGLTAAHEAGVIHRDLKPGNVMLRPDGSVKVLDFGLAKEAEARVGTSDLSASPTVSVGTQTGVILGTAAYMSPEQARGRPLDKRTDIWSFGCILYECLTGRQVFRETTVSDTLASILRSDPDWTALPAETPARTRDLLKRCLQKDPRRRLHDVADAKLEIEEALTAPPERAVPVVAASPASRGRMASLLWIGFGLVVGALLGALLTRAFSSPPRRESRAAVRSTISLPAQTRLRVGTWRPSMAFSPGGRRLVFRATRNGVTQLYLRDLGQADAAPIPGTQGAYDPFFSPDGEWLAFFSGTEMKKIALSGGAPTSLVATPPISMGGTWAPDGSIIFSPRSNGGLARLPAGAKTYQFFTSLDASRGERALAFPQMLPGGRELLVIVRAGRDFDELAASNVAVHSLETGKRRVLVEGSSFARYAEPGYLLFAKGTTLFAAPCDPRSWTLTGSAVVLLRDVLTSTYDAVPYLAVSDNGLLAYAAGGMVPVLPESVLWADRSGKEEPLPFPPLRFSAPRLSPDGKRLAIVSAPTDGGRSSLSIYDFARGVLSALTPEPARHFSPAWSPDGRRIAFSTYEVTEPRLSSKTADGSGSLEWLSPAEVPEFPTSWSPDGRTLLYTAAKPGSIENMDLWQLSLDGRGGRRPWLEGPFREFAGFFSPDGRWVAYVSNESGKNEVYVRPFPGPGPRVKISSDGGTEPAWARSGTEIFYRTADTLMVVPIQTGLELSAGTARALLPDRYDRWGREDGSRNYEVSADGSRFLFIKSSDSKLDPITQLNLVVDWPSELPTAEAPSR